MVVDSSIVEELERQIQKKTIYKVQILDEDFCRGLFDNQTEYLRSPGRADIEWNGAGRRNKYRHNKRGGTEGHDVNYPGLMF